jgi:xanthine dehydrogenase accessory factor
MDDIHRIIEVLGICDQNSVLATIIHVEGSAYRKEGTTMLFQEDGTQIGTLSGGCLEADLALRAEDIMMGRDNQMFIFNMRDEDDLLWGLGLFIFSVQWSNFRNLEW